MNFQIYLKIFLFSILLSNASSTQTIENANLTDTIDMTKDDNLNTTENNNRHQDESIQVEEQSERDNTNNYIQIINLTSIYNYFINSKPFYSWLKWVLIPMFAIFTVISVFCIFYSKKENVSTFKYIEWISILIFSIVSYNFFFNTAIYCKSARISKLNN